MLHPLSTLYNRTRLSSTGNNMQIYLLAVLFLVDLSTAQWGYGYSGYGMGLNMDPYSLGMNPYMNGMNPMMMGGGMCMDMSAQCPVWASTGQCATNPMYMQRTCGRSCGTCLGMGMGLGMGYGLGGLGGYGLGMGGINPYGLGRSIYETGILRSQPKPAILANEDVKQIKFNNEALTIPRQKLL
ncbi:unnamed protein product [Auanema sp. JU1783]|nr:unnamed protein product [Auanema sp. JU1783]